MCFVATLQSMSIASMPQGLWGLGGRVQQLAGAARGLGCCWLGTMRFLMVDIVLSIRVHTRPATLRDLQPYVTPTAQGWLKTKTMTP